MTRRISSGSSSSTRRAGASGSSQVRRAPRSAPGRAPAGSRWASQDEVGDQPGRSRARRDPPRPVAGGDERARIPGIAPISGRPSGVTGRAQVRMPTSGAPAIAGHVAGAAVAQAVAATAARSGGSGRNVEPSALAPPAVTRLNPNPASARSPRSASPPSLGLDVDVDLLEDVARRPLEGDRRRRRPTSGRSAASGARSRRSDDGRRPGSGRDDDRPGGYEAAVDLDADGARRASTASRRIAADDDRARRAAPRAPRRPASPTPARPGSRCRAGTPTSSSASAGSRLAQRRRRPRAPARSPGRRRSRRRRAARASPAAARRPDQQQPGRLVVEAERVGQLGREVAIQLQRPPVQPDEHGDRTDAGRSPELRPDAPAAISVRSYSVTRSPACGKERRGRGPDDPAADDDDVGGSPGRDVTRPRPPRRSARAPRRPGRPRRPCCSGSARSGRRRRTRRGPSRSIRPGRVEVAVPGRDPFAAERLGDRPRRVALDRQRRRRRPRVEARPVGDPVEPQARDRLRGRRRGAGRGPSRRPGSRSSRPGRARRAGRPRPAAPYVEPISARYSTAASVPGLRLEALRSRSRTGRGPAGACTSAARRGRRRRP